MTRNPKLAEVVGVALDARLEELMVCVPARVERYDSSLQLVDAQPLVKRTHEDEEGNRVLERMPVITNVPVVFPGGGGFGLRFPIARGDTVLLVFAADPLDAWKSLGGEVDPGEEGRFGLHDAVAIPGLRDFAHPRAGMPSAHIVVGREGVAEQAAALGESVQQYLNAVKAWLDALVLPVATTGTASAQAGTAGPPSVPSPPVPVVQSATVKVTI